MTAAVMQDGLLARLPPGATADVVPQPGRLGLSGPRGVRAEAPVLVVSAGEGTVRLNGREYRGHAVLRRDAKGVTAVNVANRVWKSEPFGEFTHCAAGG